LDVIEYKSIYAMDTIGYLHMNQINKQKYVNKIKSVKCDICNKDLITGYKAEAVQNGLMSDELILSQAAYHIRKHYREELPEDVSKFMIVEKSKEEEEKPQPQPQVVIKPKNTKKVKPAKEKEKEELASCKLCGSESVAFNFEESRVEHLENYHRFTRLDFPTDWFFVSAGEGVNA
jgi:hypothetical protein